MTKEKRDIYKHNQRWLKWRAEVKEGIPDISKANSDIILAYLDDMENGINTGKGCPKGERKPSRLNDLKSKMLFFARLFEERFNISDLTKVTKQDIHSLLKDMRNGEIKKQNGGDYQDTKSFARDFKAFWNWWIKVNYEKDIFIKTIVDDLNTRPSEDSKFVFLKKREIKRLLDDVKFEYRVKILSELDFCIRPPSELVNVKVSDLSKDCREVVIRDETVKKGSFGRTNKLTFSVNYLKEYLQINNLRPDDFLFNMNPASANKYLQRHAEKLFGRGMTRGGIPYHRITFYHFRHMACCYWSKILNKDLEIMKRFGWKQSNKIYYYSKFLDDDDDYDLITYLSGDEYELSEKKKSEEISQLREDIDNMRKDFSNVVNMLNTLFATKGMAEKQLSNIREDREKREALERKRNALSTYHDTD